MRLVPAFIMKVCGLSLTQKKNVLRVVRGYLGADADVRLNFDARSLRESREVVAFSMIRVYVERPFAVLAAPVGMLLLIVTLLMKVFS